MNGSAKSTKIILIIAAIIVIGVASFFAVKFWMPKPAVETSQEETSFVTTDSTDKRTCHESEKYFEVQNSLGDLVGSDILIKYKTAIDQRFSCTFIVENGDFEIKNADADYFLAFTDNFLLIDRGTAPEPRGLIVYDLRSRKQVYEDRYASPWSVAGDTVTYWNPVDTKVTTQNCPDLATYTSQGLGAVIESQVTLDLTTLTKKATGEYRCSITQTPAPSIKNAADYKDASYIIEGQKVTLVNGRAEEESAPGSASKTITQYFGNEATGDLNGDGIPDVAFILTQTGGGSGTFYYVVVALKTSDGYEGTNAMLLGDRIAPQTTEIRDGELLVNYADRAPNDPMSAKPSIGVSKYLKVTGTTLAPL
ncbi:MAG: hypothetical protein P4M11_05380 [Candidatus Pacebacteria bacterium]|nr:hypothetical protein [Candidatus Paceibacterota bacterium]